MRTRRCIIVCMLLMLWGGAAFSQAGDDKTVSAEASFKQGASLDVKNVVEIYPNPATEFLIVQIKDSDLSEVEFEMHSIIGNTIKIEPEEIAKDTYKISVKNFNTGYYFLIVKDDYTRYKKAIKFLKN